MIPKSFSRSAISSHFASSPPHPHNNGWGEETKQPNEGDEGPVARPQHLRWWDWERWSSHQSRQGVGADPTTVTVSDHFCFVTRVPFSSPINISLFLISPSPSALSLSQSRNPNPEKCFSPTSNNTNVTHFPISSRTISSDPRRCFPPSLSSAQVFLRRDPFPS